MKASLSLRKDFVNKAIKPAVEAGKHDSIMYALLSLKVRNSQYNGYGINEFCKAVEGYNVWYRNWLINAIYKLGYLQALADTKQKAVFENDDDVMGEYCTELIDEGVSLLRVASLR